MTYVVIALVASNLYFAKKLSAKETERRDVLEAKAAIRRNRKILMKQYLEMGTLERR